MSPARIAVPVLLLLATLARAELPEPKENRAATRVDVKGTVVTAEARLVAKGHEIEAVVVARLEPAATEDGAPRVRTYERWSRDGRKEFERGDKALGREWDALVRRLLKELEKEGAAEVRKGEGALGRLDRALGDSGVRVVGDRMLTWSIGVGESSAGGRRSVGRIAVVTIRPADGSTPTPDGEKRGTVTPSEGEPPVRRAIAGGAGGGGVRSSRGLASGTSDSDGVRKHALQEIDLGKPVRKSESTTPRPR